MAGIEPKTSESLLARLQNAPEDSSAWSRFVFLYGPKVIDWCRSYGLQDSDARDVAQEVLIRFSKQVGRFRYDPSRSFRAWLRTLTHAAWCDWARRSRIWNAKNQIQSPQVLSLQHSAARDELLERIESEYDRQLLETAMRRVQRRVEPRTWEAFRLMALEELSGKDAAERLDMKLGSLFAARCKVQRMIRLEVEKLDTAEG